MFKPGTNAAQVKTAVDSSMRGARGAVAGRSRSGRMRRAEIGKTLMLVGVCSVVSLVALSGLAFANGPRIKKGVPQALHSEASEKEMMNQNVRARVVTRRSRAPSSSQGSLGAAADFEATLVGYTVLPAHDNNVKARAGHSRRLETRVRPLEIAEHDASQNAWFTELTGTRAEVDEHLLKLGVRASDISHMLRLFAQGPSLQAAADEVRTLVQSGSPANRIDLVFMGDGYTASDADREKFFADVDRLVGDLFSEKTFSAYLPLFNVHAVYRASAEEGIGRGSAKDTAYGLYRPGETLRAIYPTREGALRESCAQAPDCDYPVVIANEDYYGGLGGEFAITTRALASGTVVLRHELGHNFGDVGEEYDGGGYSGANYAPSVRRIGWKDWVTASDKKAVAADMSALALGWPWARLNEKPFVQSFTSKGGKQNMLLRMSLSGLEGPGAYRVSLDGEELPVTPLPSADRSFVDFSLPYGLEAGRHELQVEALQTDGDEFLSSFSFFEYGFDPAANFEEIGAFPVFDSGGKVAGYRPTNEACLMRNMMHPWFCRVCQENNWRRLLGPLDLVDEQTTETSPDGARVVRIKTLPLGQFRVRGVARSDHEHLAITWKVDGRIVPEAADQLELRVTNLDARRVDVTVQFESGSVRKDDTGFTRSSRSVDLTRL